MSKPIRFIATLGTRPADPTPEQRAQLRDLRTWAALAQVLERGRFEALVLTDDDLAPAVTGPAGTGATLDPFMLISALAQGTRDLGLVVTASTAQEIPAVLARRLSSLDHLARGRIGWNIVSAPAELDAAGQGEEFLTLVYKLWEGSWEEGAVVRDRSTGIFADPTKVHRIDHHGPHFQAETIHLTEPSPQRTPLLVLSGNTPGERAFAARHGEMVTLSGPNAAALAPAVADLRRQAEGAGRDAADLAVFASVTLIVGATPAEAQAQRAAFSGKGTVLSGTPAELAETLHSWIRNADLDGFALSPAAGLHSYADVVDLLVPELDARGLTPPIQAQRTLRARFQGRDGLKPSHPGAGLRWPQAGVPFAAAGAAASPAPV